MRLSPGRRVPTSDGIGYTCVMARLLSPTRRVTHPTVRFTVDEYFRMAEAGVFGNARVELLDGRIYWMAPQLDPHMASITNTNRALVRVVPVTEWLIVQGTVTLDARTAVDPDFAWFACPVMTPNPTRGLPILVVEVSHTTYRYDSGRKMRKYAQAGIQDYWIVNIKANRVDVYHEPRNPTGKRDDCYFDSVVHHARGRAIPLLARPSVSLAVDELLP